MATATRSSSEISVEFSDAGDEIIPHLLHPANDGYESIMYDHLGMTFKPAAQLMKDSPLAIGRDDLGRLVWALFKAWVKVRFTRIEKRRHL